MEERVLFSLNKKTDYGLIALAHLARLADGELASAADIADRFGAPPALLSNALKDLAGAGMIESVRGSRGGYRLARPPESIDMESVMAVLQGPVRISECAAGDLQGPARCPVHGRCPVSGPLQRVQVGLVEFLRGVTLADMLAWSAEDGQ